MRWAILVGIFMIEYFMMPTIPDFFTSNDYKHVPLIVPTELFSFKKL